MITLSWARSLPTLLVSSCLLGACTLYQPAPVNLASDEEQWKDLSTQLLPKGTKLSPAQSQEIALLLNPELNASRLRVARRTAIEEHAGLWEDPSIGSDLTRVVASSTTNWGAAGGLTLPVTGLPSLARRIAQEYEQVDYWKMRTEERDFLVSLEQERLGLLILEKKLHLSSRNRRQLEQDLRRIKRFHDLGESSFAQFQIAQDRLFEAQEQERLIETKQAEAQWKFCQMLGLHPSSVPIELNNSLSLGIPAAVPAVPSATLLGDPSVRAQMAQHDASEQELRAAIRRQYPELNLTPGYEHEDGGDKWGLGISITLPLWNRNREEIAANTGQRAIEAQLLIGQFRTLTTQANALVNQQKLARRHCQQEEAQRQQGERNLNTQQRLFQLGEIDYTVLAESRYQLFLHRMSYLDCLQRLLNIQTQLRALHTSTPL